MSDLHLTPELFRAVHEANLGPGDVAALAIHHLFELCPTCKRGFDAWQEELKTGAASLPGSPEVYGPAIERSRARFAAERGKSSRAEAEVEKEIEEAQRSVAELLAKPAEIRMNLVTEAPERFRGPALAALLIDESRACFPGRAQDAHTFARLARSVLQHTEPTYYAVELYALALSHQANALRASGELRTAVEIMDVARYLLRIQGGGDRLTTAEIDWHEAALRRAQGQYSIARSLYDRAAISYSMEGASLQVAKIFLNLGSLSRDEGSAVKALEFARQAEEIFELEEDDHLLLMARHNIAHYLYEQGDAGEAKRTVAECANLYDKFPNPWFQLRRLWLEGNIARAEGDDETAEQSLLAVRDGFIRQGVGYDAALASLDLAKLYLTQGRTAELKVLATEAVKVFEAQDVHREAATALVLFQDAVAAEQITLAYLTELTRYLERARLDPTLAFQTPA